MTHVNAAVAQTELHLCRQFEQTQEVGYRGAFLAYTRRQLLLCEPILVDEFFKRQRHLYGIQILALNVFDERHLCQLAVVCRTDICRHRCQSGFLGGAATAFARNYLILVCSEFAQRERLYDSKLAYRRGKLFKRLLVKPCTRLFGVWRNLRQFNLIDSRRTAGLDVVHRNQRVESTAESHKFL